jgi:hypothetical protein
MTLTVRLDPALSSTLDAYCAEHGLTKSLVVQESLSSYLAAHSAPHSERNQPTPSANFQAFARTGLLGCMAGPGGQADKTTVRAMVQARAAKQPKPTVR